MGRRRRKTGKRDEKKRESGVLMHSSSDNAPDYSFRSRVWNWPIFFQSLAGMNRPSDFPFFFVFPLVFFMRWVT